MTFLPQSRWDEPIFPVTVVAKAAGVEVGTLRMWFVRGRIPLEPSIYGNPTFEAPGAPRKVTWRTVLTIAAAAQLVGRGVEVREAYEAAKQWTWFGDDDRDPADLFSTDFTLLAHWGGPIAKVLRLGKAGLSYNDLFGPQRPVPTPPVLVQLNFVRKAAQLACEEYLASRQATQ